AGGRGAVGAPPPVDRTVRTSDDSAFAFRIEIPKMLSLMAFRDANAFVPGINDLVYGNEKYGIPSTEQRMELGREALEALEGYREARRTGDEQEQARFEKLFNPDDPAGKAFIEKQFASIGYGFLKEPTDVVPNVPTVFYSFRVMVALGGYFILLFAAILFFCYRRTLAGKRWMLYAMLWSIPLAYLASVSGWIVAEVGRQPWTIQDLLPTVASVSRINTGSLITAFFLFVVLFTTLLIAELMIMTRQIRIGPEPPDAHAAQERTSIDNQ
uniref:cytochrome ubiquinol oxidase subunit I n=1 Tax=Alistipes ihumii TaxID=1470347 RepID=UPI003AB34F36